MKKNLIIFGLVGLLSINYSYANLSCHNFADGFLSQNGMGTQNNPSGDLYRAKFSVDSPFPEFEIETRGYSHFFGKKYTAYSLDGIYWQVSYLSYSEPELPGHFDVPRQGSYTRIYLFDTTGDSCILKGIETTFFPESSYGAERKLFTYDRCLKVAIDYLLMEDEEEGKTEFSSSKHSFLPPTEKERLAMIYGPVCSLALPYFEESQR